MYGIEQKDMYTSFYCGALAGLSAKERLEEQHKHLYREHNRLLSIAGQCKEDHDPMFGWYTKSDYSRTRFKTAAEVGSSLEECLMGSTCEQLKDALRCMGVPIPDCTLKANLVKTVAEELPKSWDCMKRILLQGGIAAIEVLLEASGSDFVTIDPSFAVMSHSIGQCFPYLFWPKKRHDGIAFLPQELRQMILSDDFAAIAEHSREVCVVEQILFGSAIICGIIALEDAYAFYSASDAQPHFTKQEFRAEAGQICKQLPCLELLTIDGNDVVVCHPTIHVTRPGDNESRHSTTRTRLFAHHVVPEFLQHRVDAVPRPFTDCFSSCDAAAHIYTLPSVVMLTDYFDCHVPRYESEITFADEMVDELISMILFESKSLGFVLAYLTKSGWFLAEGSNMAPRLTSLVCNLYRSLPRWELNGWSEQEYEDMLNSEGVIADDYLDECEYRLAS